MLRTDVDNSTPRPCRNGLLDGPGAGPVTHLPTRPDCPVTGASSQLTPASAPTRTGHGTGSGVTRHPLPGTVDGPGPARGLAPVCDLRRGERRPTAAPLGDPSWPLVRAAGNPDPARVTRIPCARTGPRHRPTSHRGRHVMVRDRGIWQQGRLSPSAVEDPERWGPQPALRTPATTPIGPSTDPPRAKADGPPLARDTGHPPPAAPRAGGEGRPKGRARRRPALRAGDPAWSAGHSPLEPRDPSPPRKPPSPKLFHRPASMAGDNQRFFRGSL